LSFKAQMDHIRRSLATELDAYRRVLRHRRTPWLARLLLALAVGYVLLPFDLVPDFIPVLGQLDDLFLVPALVLLALKLVPADVLRECRALAAARRS
jgi:uncharacterized membrane protein YkvA (DUF1232 family)